jgi:hypothetical protein
MLTSSTPGGMLRLSTLDRRSENGMQAIFLTSNSCRSDRPVPRRFGPAASSAKLFPGDFTMTVAKSTHTQEQPYSSNRKWLGLIVFLAMAILVVHWVTNQLALMREYGPDPQISIGIVFMVAKLMLWLIGGGLVAGVLFLEKPHWRIIMGVILLLGWSYRISNESWKVQTQQRALAEARNPSTSSARLDQLLQFAGSQGDYELDNRIAANPNSTPEILRKLYGRHQLGTLMILARSPKTPEDILQAMVDYDLTRANQAFENEWIRKSLQQNPNLPEAVRRKL